MSKMTRAAAAALLLFAVGKTAVAQEYAYSTFTAPFQYLANPDTLNLDYPDWDDDVFFIAPGFSVNIMGETYDSLAVEANGALIFYNNSVEITDGMDTLPVMMPFGEFLSNSGDVDLRYRTPGNSPIGFEITGAPGARIAKIEWRNAGFYNDPNDNEDFVNFQAWIYEGSGDVEYRYGSSQVSPESYDGATGPTVGIGPIDPIDFNFLTGYYLTGDSTAATLSNTYAMLTGTPVDGTVFRFANNSTIGVNERATRALAVYPNPAADAVNIRFDAEGSTLVAITDLTGHTIAAEQLVAQGEVTLKMDVSALAPGMYCITLNGNATGTKVIVK